jgi:signal transduction histidine kinase
VSNQDGHPAIVRRGLGGSSGSTDKRFVGTASASGPRAGPGRRSLGARAALFTLTGSGALLGAMVVLSSLILQDARARILTERQRLVRATAQLLEARLQGDLDRLANAAVLFLQPHGHAVDDLSHTVALRQAAASGAFAEGAFVLDPDGVPVASAPGPLEELARVPDVTVLRNRAVGRKGVATSGVVRIGKKPVVVVVAPVVAPEGAGGLVVGLIQPAASDLLEHLREEGADAEMALMDAAGTVVAATDRRRLLEHREEGGRAGEVVAQAALPHFGLTLEVTQPEAVALAPAHALQLLLWSLAGALILIFVLFNLLAVRSVVLPVKRLTWAVRRAEARGSGLSPHTFGPDEVGELAEALASSRQRMLESLAQLGASQDELRGERDRIHANLELLYGISESSTRQVDLRGFLAGALEAILARSGGAQGALAMEHGGGRQVVQVGLSDEEAAAWLTRARVVRVEDGVSVALAQPPETPEDLWLEPTLREVAVGAAHLLLRATEAERRQQRGRYLARVLQAQEDERRRVARELHDTVAQDLAALRLALERAGRHAATPELAATLSTLEAQASQMLGTVRQILLDLRLSVLESQGFIPAIRWLLERTEREHGLRTHLVVDGDEEAEVGYDRSISLFRILQESLLNVIQHARAERVFVTVSISEAGIDLTVEDDGVGFEPAVRAASTDDGHGLGILGMAERARILGGALELVSAPDEGTSVHVFAPRPTEAAA